jgi:hypothetical protein
MFRTQDHFMAGLPGLFAPGLSMWRAVSRILPIHWYHVTLKVREEGRLMERVEMCNDETLLAELVALQDDDIVLIDVQVVTPGWMNKTGAWKMIRPSRVSIAKHGKYDSVVIIELSDGTTYYDSHRPIQLAKLKNVYPVYTAAS